MATATTSEKIEKALRILKSQDWYWMMADYTHPAYDLAYNSMRAFVKLVAGISEKDIAKALRELWITTYKYEQATMWHSSEKAKAEYESKKAELMSIILPQFAMVA